MQRFESFENASSPLAGRGAQSFGSHEDDYEPASSQSSQFGKALYDFNAGRDDELNLTAGEDLEIDYEVDGWFYVKKKKPGRDGKMVGLYLSSMSANLDIIYLISSIHLASTTLYHDSSQFPVLSRKYVIIQEF
ncbi:hypothetical protein C5167_034605 [Papaver somniferum]|uniref:SH3 domain-containing protein n=1 Tax=Papaver somniferum TaxID=3469 RepID=A0A4Y7KDF6_PAPSO|nr:hypothetical protein C5167_034605 [Papaver somniferum]